MRESTLSTHACEKRRRHLLKDDISTRYAMMSYLRWYEIMQRRKDKTFDDFCSSEFYIGFMKFGNFLLTLKPVNLKQFIDYVIVQNLKLDKWCENELYYSFIADLTKRENPEEAVERTITTMLDWSDTKKTDWNLYFKEATLIRISRDIKEGRISPWIVLNSKSGMSAIRRFPDEELNSLDNIIAPAFWFNRFKKYPDEMLFIKEIVETNGL